MTGATRTNVNDFRAILIDAKPGDPGPTSRKPRPRFHTENLSHVPTPQPPRQDRRHAGSGQQRPRYLRSLFHAGVDVFRLNFSHGSAEDHAVRMAILREIEAETGRPIGVMADLQGPAARGRLRAGRCNCGQRFRLT